MYIHFNSTIMDTDVSIHAQSTGSTDPHKLTCTYMIHNQVNLFNLACNAYMKNSPEIDSMKWRLYILCIRWLCNKGLGTSQRGDSQSFVISRIIIGINWQNKSYNSLTGCHLNKRKGRIN